MRDHRQLRRDWCAHPKQQQYLGQGARNQNEQKSQGSQVFAHDDLKTADGTRKKEFKRSISIVRAEQPHGYRWANKDEECNPELEMIGDKEFVEDMLDCQRMDWHMDWPDKWRINPQHFQESAKNRPLNARKQKRHTQPKGVEKYSSCFAPSNGENDPHAGTAAVCIK